MGIDDAAVAQALEMESDQPLMGEKRTKKPSTSGAIVKPGKKSASKGKNGRSLFCYGAQWRPHYPYATVYSPSTGETATCMCSLYYCDWQWSFAGRRRAVMLSDEEAEEIAEFVEEAAPLMAEKRSSLPSSKGAKTKQGSKARSKGKHGRRLVCYDAEINAWYPGAQITHYDTRTTYTCTCSSFCYWSSRQFRRRAVMLSDEEAEEIAEFVEEAAPLMAERKSSLPSSKGAK